MKPQCKLRKKRFRRAMPKTIHAIKNAWRWTCATVLLGALLITPSKGMTKETKVKEDRKTKINLILN